MTAEPNLYAYDDFRRFLVDWLAHKRRAKGFSARLFAKRAGFGAHDIFQLVSSGRRNLSIKSIAKFARGLGLTSEQSAYFEALVLMNQSESAPERLGYYERLLSFPQRRRIVPMEKAQLAFFRTWLAPVIYEMVSFPDFEPDPHWIAAQFSEPVSTVDIKRALAAISEAGLVEVRNGRWRQASPEVDTGDGVRDVHLYAYHEHALTKANDALELPSRERYFQVTTVAASSKALAEVKELAQKFEIEALRILQKHDAPPDEVYQFGLQLFPTVRRPQPAKKRRS